MSAFRDLWVLAEHVIKNGFLRSLITCPFLYFLYFREKLNKDKRLPPQWPKGLKVHVYFGGKCLKGAPLRATLGKARRRMEGRKTALQASEGGVGKQEQSPGKKQQSVLNWSNEKEVKEKVMKSWWRSISEAVPTGTLFQVALWPVTGPVCKSEAASVIKLPFKKSCHLI